MNIIIKVTVKQTDEKAYKCHRKQTKEVINVENAGANLWVPGTSDVIVLPYPVVPSLVSHSLLSAAQVLL